MSHTTKMVAAFAAAIFLGGASPVSASESASIIVRVTVVASPVRSLCSDESHRCQLPLRDEEEATFEPSPILRSLASAQPEVLGTLPDSMVTITY